jgi:hypothetical protein
MSVDSDDLAFFIVHPRNRWVPSEAGGGIGSVEVHQALLEGVVVRGTYR